MKRQSSNSKKIVGGAGVLLLGASAAAAFAMAREPGPVSSATPAPLVAALPANRIAVSPDSLKQAFAAGTIDRPIKSILNVPVAMRYGDYRWDEQGVPAGEIWIRVDLRSQIVSVFRAGHEIGTAVILYGADGVPTPTGKFPILAKMKDHRSQTYDAPMPYTLRLTSDGVSIHASNVRWGYATHGCIGVPEAFAAKLFAAAAVGSEVMISGAARAT